VSLLTFIELFSLDIRFQLNEQLKCLEQRIDTQLSIVSEIQEYFRRRADVELDYAKTLDNLHKQIGQKHRTQKAKQVNGYRRQSTKHVHLSLCVDETIGFINRSISFGIRSCKTHVHT
jgi:hypothetical protein